jgi:hypothetical protein
MRCLTLTQPWATLVAVEVKQVETRNWSTRYRGLLAIHAGQGYGWWSRSYLAGLCQTEPFCQVLDRVGCPSFDRLPRGAVIAVCQLTDGRITATTVPPEPERSFGDYTPGRWAWRLDGITPLAEPIPAVGAWGLWSPPADLISFLG